MDDYIASFKVSTLNMLDCQLGNHRQGKRVQNQILLRLINFYKAKMLKNSVVAD